MIVTTLDTVAGRMTDETLGVVRGSGLWTRRITKFAYGGLRNLHATGLQELDEGLNQAKESATKEMNEQARKMGADAVVGMRLEVIEMSSGIYCVNACGTAVKLEMLPQAMPPFAGKVHVAINPVIAYAAARPSVAGSDLRH
jgi:uncharacterized protein YbjQ (UPF0145 family)